MKKFTFLPLLFLSLIVFGQTQIVVQNGTSQSFENLTDAVNSATAGDTIYIPGGGFASPVTITKSLHWRGVGHYPDSTAATGYTLITGAITFNTDCDNSTFEGIYFESNVTFGNVTNEEVTGVTMKRCRVGGVLYLRKDASITNGYPDLGFHLRESLVVTIAGQNARNCLIENNLIFGSCSFFNYSIFDHNSLNYSYLSINNNTNCRFSNNVFAWATPSLSGSSNCEFLNNVFGTLLPYNPTTEPFTGSNNITEVGRDNMYTTITGLIYNFSYDNDYHLNPSATGTNEAGTTGISIAGSASDGTNPGIYGGLGIKPYKEGAVPYSPHIRLVDIDNEAVNGELGVKITVASQEK